MPSFTRRNKRLTAKTVRLAQDWLEERNRETHEPRDNGSFSHQTCANFYHSDHARKEMQTLVKDLKLVFFPHSARSWWQRTVTQRTPYRAQCRRNKNASEEPLTFQKSTPMEHGRHHRVPPVKKNSIRRGFSAICPQKAHHVTLQKKEAHTHKPQPSLQATLPPPRLVNCVSPPLLSRLGSFTPGMITAFAYDISIAAVLLLQVLGRVRTRQLHSST